MENNALALVPRSNTINISAPNMPSMAEIEAMNAMCKIAAYSGFLSSTAPISNTTQRAADAFFVMMYGRELGIPAMTALKTIYVIDGKPSCSGQALLSLMRKGGMEVEIPDPGTVTTSATVKVKRPGGSWKTFTYTQAMAEAAGLWNSKGNWKKHPAEMLIWRAVSTAARFEGSDIVGALYTTEELQPDRPVNEQGDPLDMPMVTISAPAPEAPAENPDNGPLPEPEAEPEAAKSEQSVYAGVSPRDMVDGSAGTDDGNRTDAEAVIEFVSHKVKYVGPNNNAHLKFWDASHSARRYGRDMLRELGDTFKVFADALTVGPDSQNAIDLPQPVRVWAVEKTTSAGIRYWSVTRLVAETVEDGPSHPADGVSFEDAQS